MGFPSFFFLRTVRTVELFRSSILNDVCDCVQRYFVLF